MLRLLFLTCLLAAAAAQQPFHCYSGDLKIVASDFYLITRRQGDTGYPPGLSCAFNVEYYLGTETEFLVEIISFSLSTATLTISSGGRTLFSGSRIENYQSSIRIPGNSTRISFNAMGDYSGRSGVKLRIRAFRKFDCPPGWSNLDGICYGTSNTSGRLNFVDAQKACNSMRSNLLQIPSLYSSNIKSFMRMLPRNLRLYYTWAGLTDKTSAGRYVHYWLNGNRQFETSEISCVSSGSYFTCYSYERCGSLYEMMGSRYSIFMDNCADRNDFACSAPPGGTNVFYRVPDEGGVTTIVPSYTYRFNGTWIWVTAVACVFAVGLVIVGAHARSRQARRTAGATSVVVTAGRVTAPPPRGSYPVQHPPPMQYPAPQMPQYPQQVPPTYEAAVAGGYGYGNNGYKDNN